ncbi:MAG: ABC transporter, partial [Arthrobacter sp.]|nr:ABC transporter [Arthrobacter sp.]
MSSGATGAVQPADEPPTEARPTVITAENLTKTYGDVAAVDGISFSVPAGESFGLLGPNGAGK